MSERGFHRLLPWLAANRGLLALEVGDPAAARALAEQAALMAPDAGRVRPRALLLRARAIAASGGAVTEIRQAFEGAIEAHELEPPRARARAHQFYSEALSRLGLSSEAYEQARSALELIGARD